jgi:hypothetical protein
MRAAAALLEHEGKIKKKGWSRKQRGRSGIADLKFLLDLSLVSKRVAAARI